MPAVLILVEERAGVRRVAEPVTVGLPFPKGRLFSPSELHLQTVGGERLPLQAATLARWSDGSVKWALFDFQACVEALSTTTYELVPANEVFADAEDEHMVVEQSSDGIVVDTGVATFVLDPHRFAPFRRVRLAGADVLPESAGETVLTDERGRRYEPHITHMEVETRGRLRTTVLAQGQFRDARLRPHAEFVGRVSFYGGSGTVEIRLTVRNPRAAGHRGGFWDLGARGSLYLKELSLRIGLGLQRPLRIEWLDKPGASTKGEAHTALEIYQDSSGGRNWQSSNHVNRDGVVMNTFRGYRVVADTALRSRGDRAGPTVTVRDARSSLTVAIEGFWQNFPKAIKASGRSMVIGLFPAQYRDVHELQGGEQKSHVVMLHFGSASVEPAALGWAHDRLIPRTTPEWYAETQALPYVTPIARPEHPSKPLSEADGLVQTAVAGPESFFARREIIDEYGWRHFGDLYADHEAVRRPGPEPLVAHYNNQYDVLHGAAVQYLRSGDPRWFDLLRDLARHVIDIDVYHTDRDRPAFNGGMFWHTEHYTDAATSTHRCHSRANVGARSARLCGGGPSSEHNYPSGLLAYYYLTGDPLARETVRGLAEWVLAMDDGRRRFGGWLDRRCTGFASMTVSRDYHGPGRGCGNSLNALMDGYAIAGDARYRAKAEELIRRSVHPREDIARRRLDDVEHRWSYTVFLQALGRYLDLKVEAGETDRMFAYARESLLHYARWMAKHEVPYKVVLDRVEIPTETWPAHDVRKANVFAFATKYAREDEAPVFAERADFFFSRSLSDLLSFETARLTRPLVILMTNAYMQGSRHWRSGSRDWRRGRPEDFGEPRDFVPQFAELYRLRAGLNALARRLRAAVR